MIGLEGRAMASVPQFNDAAQSEQEWKDLLKELLPAQGEWSQDEYLVLTEHSSRLVEYTDGCLEPLPMPTDKHQSVLKFLLFAFSAFVEARGGKVQFALLRLQIRQGKFREPDLLLLLSATDPRRQNRFWLGCDLALEVVSEEKPERDLIEKRGDYAEGRVPEYWIVNPQTETISVLHLSGDSYAEVGTYRRGDAALSVLLSGFPVAVASVFDAD
jgi:Uma2 family endonuclease